MDRRSFLGCVSLLPVAGTVLLSLKESVPLLEQPDSGDFDFEALALLDREGKIIYKKNFSRVTMLSGDTLYIDFKLALQGGKPA